MAAQTPAIHVPNPLNIPKDVFGAVESPFKAIAKAEVSVIERFAEGILGLMLIGIGVVALARPTPVGQAVVKTTKNSAKLASVLAK